jgi:hypothetical protein
MSMTADEFNERHIPGELFDYYPVKGKLEHERVGTRSEAWELGHGAAVVLIEGHRGGVSVDHLVVPTNN